MVRRILYVASTDRHLRSFHRPYLAALAAEGYTVTCAGSGDGHGLPEGVAFFPVPFTKSFFSPRNLRAALSLARLIRRERFDLILLHTSLAAFFTRLGVLLAGKGSARVVNTVHGYLFDGRSPLLRRRVLLSAERLMRFVTDDILTMNAEDTAIARDHRLCRDSITEIPGMGLPIKKYAPSTEEERHAARKELGIGRNAFVLLCAAEFSERKNQSVLLRAMRELPQEVMLLLPGAGEKREECIALARSLGIEDRVSFPGFVTELAPYLRAADLCVSASRSEGLPFHVMECMASSLPSVLSDVKGHRDLMQSGGGTLYPFGDEKALAEAVKVYLREPGLRKTHGERAREAVQAYALDAVLPQVMALYLGSGQKNNAPFGTDKA